MNMLRRHVLRTAFKKSPRLFGIAALVALSMGLYVGNYSAIYGLTDFVLSYYNNAKMAQLEIKIATDDQINLADYSDIDAIQATEARLYLPGVAELGDEEVSLLIVGRPDLQSTDLNSLRSLGGDMAAARGTDIILERNCAQHYGLELGETLRARVGEDGFDLRVVAVGESPEFLIAPANPTAFLPTSGSLCVVFMDLEWLQNWLGFNGVNSLLFGFEDRATAEAARDAVLERTRQHSSIDQIVRDTEQFGYLFLEIDMETFKTFVPAVILVFCISSLFVVAFLGVQWIASERSEIGMLLAMGYSAARIVRAYAVILLVVIVMAWLLAIPFSYGGMIGFGNNFAKAIGMPEPQLSLLPGFMIKGAIGAALIVAAAMLAPMQMIFGMRPIEAVRGPNTTESFSIPQGLRRRAPMAPGWLRLGLRNALRRPVVAGMTILSVALCLGITMSFSISLTSMERTALASFERDSWTANVDLSRPIWADQIDEEFTAYAPADQWEGFVRGAGFVGDVGNEQNIFITGIREGSAKTLFLLEGTMPRGDGIVMENKLVQDLGLTLGDEVELNTDGVLTSARLVGIHSGSVPGEVWTNLAFGQSLFGREDQYSGLFFTGPVPEGGGEIRSQVLSHPDVINFFTLEQAMDAVLTISNQVRIIMLIGTLFAVGGGILFVFVNLSFTILAREGEYCMMRVLGFGRRKVSATILAEVMLICAIAVGLSPLVGYAVGYTLNSRLADVWFFVETHMSLTDILWNTLPALALIPFAACPAIVRITSAALSTIIQQRRIQ